MGAAALLFASGAAALIYQVLWVKQLSLVAGVDVYAITTGVSAFLAGLGFGGYLFGRIADRSNRPLVLYALLEIGAAVLGVTVTIGLAHTAPIFARGEAQIGFFAWVLPFLLVGTPALVMGGTLPVLVRTLLPKAGELGSAGRWLVCGEYGWGSCGRSSVGLSPDTDPWRARLRFRSRHSQSGLCHRRAGSESFCKASGASPARR